MGRLSLVILTPNTTVKVSLLLGTLVEQAGVREGNVLATSWQLYVWQALAIGDGPNARQVAPSLYVDDL